MLQFAKYATAISLLLIISNAYAQDKTIDSLKTILRNPKIHDTTKLRSIATVTDHYYNETDKTYYYLNQLSGSIAYKNYKKKNNSPKLQQVYTNWLAGYYSGRGVEYLHKPNPEKGLAYFDQSIALFKSTKSFREMHFALVVKSSLYTKMYEYEKAIAGIFKALKFFEQSKEQYAEDLAYAYSGLAFIYSRQEKYEKAIEYNQKVLACYGEFDSDNYVNYLTSQVHSRMATAYMALKKYPETILHAQKALQLSEHMNDKHLKIQNLCRIGSVKMKQAKYDEAEKIFTEALTIQDSSDQDVDNTAIINAYISMGRLYYLKGDLSKASNYAEKGFTISQKANNLDMMNDSSWLLYQINTKAKSFEKALEMYLIHEKLVDSTNIEASKNAMEQQQLKYNFEKKSLNLKLEAEKKNAVKNNWLMGLSGVLLMVLFGGYFYYRNNKQKQSIAVLEKNQIKQKLLITQMNPHFIFNSIENIRSLIYQNQNDDAVNYLGKFSTLTRQILENSNENYISLEEEVSMIENYLSIQQLLYSNKFNFTINVEPEIDTESIFLPPMLTQPFIENAIKHGLSNTTSNGMIGIRFYLKESKLFFEVTDNGKGFDANKKTNSHKSLAMTITKERLVGYTKDQNFVVQTDNIKDKGDNVVGAKVIFEIPYIYEN
jgi:tetratricopeptide (TPR) repeat protein